MTADILVNIINKSKLVGKIKKNKLAIYQYSDGRYFVI